MGDTRVSGYGHPMHNENIETAGDETAEDRMGDIRTAITSADDTGMVAQQELLHEVGDAETADDERDAEGTDVERA